MYRVSICKKFSLKLLSIEMIDISNSYSLKAFMFD